MSLLSSITNNMWSDAANLLRNQLVNTLFNRVANETFRRTVYDRITRTNWMEKLETKEDPQLNIHWSVIMPFGLPPMYIDEATIPPFPTFDTTVIQVNNKKRIDPGFMSIDNLDLTFPETVTGTVHAFINYWRSLIEFNGYYGKPTDYKRTIVVLLHDSKGEVGIVFTYNGCWPISVSGLNLQSGSADLVRLSVQFSVETVNVEIVGQDSVSNLLTMTTRSIENQLRDRLVSNVNNYLSNGIRTLVGSILPF